MSEEEAKELIGQCYDIIDRDGELDEYQKGVKDALEWIYERGDKPELED